uniref:Calx-beta domain-containing protein n=1 Tax=Panagrellus redivivus TaxID=6233 RepID=A0A7E5A1Z2_PANRE
MSLSSLPSLAPSPMPPSLESPPPGPMAGPCSLLPQSNFIGLNIETMHLFLSDPDAFTCTLRIFHPKLVQRSYGKEKRFFNPPTLIYIHGNGWHRNDARVREILSRYHVSMQSPNYIPNSPTLPNLPVRWQASVGIGDGTSQMQLPVDARNFVVARSLFISNADKRKQFRITVDFTSFNGPSTLYPVQPLGTFNSSEIRVVSKPPKKQSTRSAESAMVCLKSGMIVAIYNRIRAQSVSTRYLYTQGTAFVGSNDVWSAYYIFAVDKVQNSPLSNSFVMDEGFIHYGDIVRLVDALTGVSSPNMIIRRIEKDEIVLVNSADPVAQLQKVAFQLCDSVNVYWSVSMAQVVQKEATIMSEIAHKVEDSFSWTLTQADVKDYKFFEGNGPSSTPVTPIPIVENLTLDGTSEENAVVEVMGTDLGKRLTVWFGLVASETIEANRSFIQCRVPPVGYVNAHHPINADCEMYGTSICVPLTLVRDDGVIYPTKAQFLYSCNTAGPLGNVVTTDLAAQRRSEFSKHMLELNRTRFRVQDQVRSEVSNVLRKRAYEGM